MGSQDEGGGFGKEPRNFLEEDGRGEPGSALLPTMDAGLLARRGAVGGLLGGLAMLLAAIVISGLAGRGLLTPLRLVAAMVYGAALGGIAPVLVGLALHLGVTALFGVVLAFLVGGSNPGNLVVWGIAYSVSLWVFAQFLIIPRLNPIMAAGCQPFFTLICHVIYGAVLGAYLNRLSAT